MDQRRKKLKNRLSRTMRKHDYIPVIETTQDSYMIWASKYSVISRRVSYNYDLYIESKGTSEEEHKLKDLKDKVRVAVELNIGAWNDLKGFIDQLSDEDIASIEQSIGIY